MTGNIHKVQRGEYAWKVAKEIVTNRGEKATDAKILAEIKRLAALNDCDDVQDFNEKYFGGKIGKEFKTGEVKPQGAEGSDGESIPEAVDARKEYVIKDSVDKIVDSIVQEGGDPHRIETDDLAPVQRSKILSYQNLYGNINPQIVRNEVNGEVHVFLDVSRTQRGREAGLSTINIRMSDEETKITRYHRSGRVAQDIENHVDPSKNRSILIQGENVAPTQVKQINTPLDIDIKINDPMYTNASASQKKDIDKFLNTLKSEKANLMADLGIDNDTYNRYAKLAVGIAMRESKLGTADRYKYWDNSFIGIGIKDIGALFNRGLHKLGIKNPFNDATSVSKGMTQIKVGDWLESPNVKKMFNKYGIKRGFFNSLSPEQSAAATIIVLKELDARSQQKVYREGIEAANNRYYAADKILVDGKPVKLDATEWRENKITDDDAILYLYNGRIKPLKNGTATPADNIYTHDVRRFMNNIEITEDETARAEAMKDAVVVEQGAKNNSVKMKDDLGWGIGQITFKPDLYTEGANKTSKEEADNLKSTLQAKGYDGSKINQLIKLITDGEITFAKGLSNAEMRAMTERDIEMILRHYEDVSTKLKSETDPVKRREIAGDADKKFKREYLSHHARRVSLNSVKDNTVTLPSSKNVKEYPKNGYYTGAQARCKQYLPQLRGNHSPDAGIRMYNDRVKSGKYTGFKIEEDKGINYAGASEIDLVLAKNAADVANTLRTSGGCLTGAKQALIGSGACSAEELRDFSNAHQLADFCARHPERFIEVTYIKVDDKTAREITSGDISHLPAGYIPVYGNAHRSDVPGHSGVTSGNNQIYSDEIDNANWDNFVSSKSDHDGKGEHGYVRVFRLNPAYFTVDESGKKLIKK